MSSHFGHHAVSLLRSELADAPRNRCGRGSRGSRSRVRPSLALCGLPRSDLGGRTRDVPHDLFGRRTRAAHRRALGSVPGTGSFPSGHVAAAIVLYGYLAFLLRTLAAPRLAPVAALLWTVVAAVAAVAVGWARMYRGIHHPLDVLAGAAMCTVLLVVFVISLRLSQEESA
jgi:membrane-associated phospholipid phosphatase